MSDFFSWDLIDLSKIKGSSGEVVSLCPICSHTRKKKSDKCLGVNLDAGLAHCCHCGAKSKRNIEEKVFEPKEYVIPKWKNNTNLPDKVVNWFKDERNISQKTLIDNSISYGMEWMPQTQKESGTIQFPYLAKGKVINVKYRTAQKHFKLCKDAQKILYGVDHLKGKKVAYFVEGEIDKLSFYEAGIYNVVSCPNGVALSMDEKARFESSGQFNDNNVLNLDYLTDSMQYIDHVEKWILCTDKDAAGQKLQRELIRRFGAENCEILDLKGYKDANELLVKEGVTAFEKLISVPVPIDGVYSIEDEWDYIQDIRDNGYKKGSGIGVESYDKHYKYRLGEIDLIGGIPNHGKTTFVAWEIVLTARLFGWKWCVYSPENYPAGELYISLIETYLNKDVSKQGYLPASNSDMEEAKEFIHNHVYVIDWDEDDVLVNPEMVLNKTKELIKRKGVNAMLIDPWNDLYHEFKGGENDAKYLQRILSQCRRFKRKYNIKFIINAHPIVSKIREREEHPEQGDRQAVVWFYDVDGGAMWGNRMDNCRTIYRNVTDESYRNTTEVHVQKIKHQKLVGLPTTDTPIKMIYSGKRFLINGFDPLDIKVEKPDYVQKDIFQNHSIEDFENEDCPF
jgi:twinkle protein